MPNNKVQNKLEVASDLGAPTLSNKKTSARNKEIIPSGERIITLIFFAKIVDCGRTITLFILLSFGAITTFSNLFILLAFGRFTVFSNVFTLLSV